ncbi:MAG: uroporphyrinogen-III C-methyltransferase [Holophagaceae bacterium]
MSSVLPLQRGFAWLVGAGPGHPDFLTLRGLRALRGAEVILHDALLDEAFFGLFPGAAQAVFVGKRAGDHALSQTEISALLVAKVREGKKVVRLKGGDPFLFGRGGEEALALREAGLPFEVIPGVSALHGVAGAAGIPLTHRGLSREVRILEGHGLLDEDRDWAELARFRGTLVLFMATGQLARIAQTLLAHGADPAKPVALVEEGCTPRQRTRLATLADAAARRMPSCTDGPGLVVLGPTVALQPLLANPLLFPDLPRSLDPHAHPPSRLPQSPRPARPPRRRRERRAG